MSRSLYCFATGISLLCMCLYWLDVSTANLAEWLMYQRNAIGEGELWRLFSGNLLHTNHWHLLMNLGGLWIILALHHFHYRLKGIIALFCLLCLLQGAALYWLCPNLQRYLGLSGILHGLFAYGSVLDIRRKLYSGYLLLLGVIIKVTYEQWQGASDALSVLIEARVATEAHLIGLGCGLMCAFVSAVSGKLRHDLRP